ncbi:MAG: negative regulator of septation ring formation, partial [Xanthobacteraceae bacterium]
MKDPTDPAVTAIQEVLSTTDQPADARTGTPNEAAGQPRETARRGARAPTPAEKDLFEGAMPGAEEELRPGRQAANDDRQSIGQILQTLQRRPPRTSYLVASIFALAWVVGGLLLAALYLPDLQTVVTQGPAAIPALIGLAGFVLAPIVFFYVLAHIVWRSQELRLIAQSMASVAMRLAEPEEVARDSIVTVGQAIRREVAAMGDGVERALARAAELEALVANEVSALERAYNDNEVRIRGLLETLAHQRDTLVGQAEQVRNAITGVHLDLSHDIASVSDHVAERVNESAQKIAQALTEKGEHITLALGRAGDSMIGALGERGGDLLERLERASQETSHAIANASDRLTSSLNFKTDHITEEFAELTTNLAQMMEGRLEEVTQDFAQRSTSIVQLMEDRTQQITETLVDTSSQLAEAIATSGDEVNSTLKSTGDSLVLDLSLRGGDVVSKLEQTGARITETIVTRGDKVTETFRENAEHLASTVATQGDAVREMLAARLQAFEEMFSHGGSELAEKITRDSSTLG